jgi:hypothetical protein
MEQLTANEGKEPWLNKEQEELFIFCILGSL